jgi:hypothetical protein
VRGYSTVGVDAGGAGKARQRMEREQAVAEQIDALTAAAVRDASSTPVVLAVRSCRPVRHGSSLTSGTCCSVRLRRPLCGSTLALAQASPYQWRRWWHTWTSKWSWQGGLSPPLSVILPVRRATSGRAHAQKKIDASARCSRSSHSRRRYPGARVSFDRGFARPVALADAEVF